MRSSNNSNGNSNKNGNHVPAILKHSFRIDTWDTVNKCAKGITPHILYGAACDMAAGRNDLVIDKGQIRNAGLRFQDRHIVSEGGPWVTRYNVEELALSQLCERLSDGMTEGDGSCKTIPTPFIRSIDSDIADTILNRMVERSQSDCTFRFHDDDLRAVMSGSYTRIDADDMLGLAAEILDDAAAAGEPLRCVPFRPQLWRDGCDVALITHIRDSKKDGGDGSTYGGGVVISTGSVGNMKASVLPFVMRTSCTNSTRIDSENSVSFRHVGSREAKLASMQAAFLDGIKVSEHLYDLMMKARRQRLPSFRKVVEGVVSDLGLTEDFFSQMLIGSEGSQTLWGLSNGMTFAAQKSETTEERIKIETLAGNILDPELQPAWLMDAIKNSQRELVPVTAPRATVARTRN